MRVSHNRDAASKARPNIPRVPGTTEAALSSPAATGNRWTRRTLHPTSKACTPVAAAPWNHREARAADPSHLDRPVRQRKHRELERCAQVRPARSAAGDGPATSLVEAHER